MSQGYKFVFLDYERTLERDEKDVKEIVFSCWRSFSVAQERKPFKELIFIKHKHL